MLFRSVFKALAHPSRMHIVSMLSGGPKNVGELTEAVGFDISTVSKHLSVLRAAGVVLDETRGRSVYYSLYCSCIPEFIHCVDDIVSHTSCPVYRRHPSGKRLPLEAPAKPSTGD